MPAMKWLCAIAVMLLAPLLPAAAQDQPDGFRSPSGNIYCQAFKLDDGTGLRCDIRQVANKPPPKPKDCDLDWGRAFELSDKAKRAARICHGDTVMNDALPPLAYGASWRRHGFTCASEQSGVTCGNTKGNGFELSRGKQSLF